MRKTMNKENSKSFAIWAICLILAIVSSVVLLAPEAGHAVYYDRQGQPLAPVSLKDSLSIVKEKPLDIGIPIWKRNSSMTQYNYIVDHSCKALATDLYKGETLYECDNDQRLWSYIVPSSQFPILTAVKNRSEEDDRRAQLEAANAAADAALSTMIIMSAFN
jgi:hypothetical protein